MAEHHVGTVSHYFGNLGVAGIELSSELRVGDTIHVLGHTSDFIQIIVAIKSGMRPLSRRRRALPSASK